MQPLADIYPQLRCSVRIVCWNKLISSLESRYLHSLLANPPLKPSQAPNVSSAWLYVGATCMSNAFVMGDFTTGWGFRQSQIS